MNEALIAEVLNTHFAEATGLGEVACRCDHQWQPTSRFRAHVAAEVAKALAARAAAPVEAGLVAEQIEALAQCWDRFAAANPNGRLYPARAARAVRALLRPAPTADGGAES